MSNHASANPHRFIANMATLTVNKANNIATEDHQAMTPTTADIEGYAQDKTLEVTDTEAVDIRRNHAVDLASSSTETALLTSAKIPWGIFNSGTFEGHASQAAPAFTALQSNQPIPTIYPPQRANIFRTREKHVRFPVSGLSAVAPRTTGPTIQELEEADGFAVADMEEFQKDVKARMEAKTAKFMSKMRQDAWKQSRVEDLGEVFAIED